MAKSRRTHIVPFPADDFLWFVRQAIKNDRPELEIRDLEIAGEVDLSGWKFPRGLKLEGISFRDAVLMRNCAISGEFSLIDCDFNTLLDLSNAICLAGAVVDDCSFGLDEVSERTRVLSLGGARVSGDLSFRETTISGLLFAQRLDVEGDMSFRGCTIEGDSTGNHPVVDLTNAKFFGSLNLGQSGTIESRSPFGPLHGESAAGAQARRTVFIDRNRDTSVSLRNANAVGVSLGAARFVGGLDFHYLTTRFLQSLVLRFAQRAGDIDWRSGLCVGGAEVEGDISLSGGVFGTIRFLGIYVSGTVRLIDGRSGQIEIEDGFRDGSRFLAVSSFIGRFFMSSWQCHEFIRLHPSFVWGTGDDPALNGIFIISSKIERGLSLWPGQRIANTKLGQLHSSIEDFKKGVHVFERDEKGRGAWHARLSYPNRWARRMKVRGKVSLTHTTIGEDLVLTGLDVQDSDVSGGACIEALYCQVQGHVRFDTPTSYLIGTGHETLIWQLLARFLVVARSAEESGRKILAGSQPIASAICDRVDLTDLEAEGVELSGLRIRAAGSGERAWNSGVDLHSSKIRQKLTTLARMSSKQMLSARHDLNEVLAEVRFSRRGAPGGPGQVDDTAGPFPSELLKARPEHMDRRWHILSRCFGRRAVEAVAGLKGEMLEPYEESAFMPGALNLQTAELNEFTVSDASFSDCNEREDAAKNGIVLAFAKVNKFYVARHKRVTGADKKHNGFPVPLDLLDIEVRSWFLESGKDSEQTEAARERVAADEASDPDSYLDLLDNDPKFRMSSYLAIERSLRDRGLEEEATRIYIAGVYRDTRTAAPDPPAGTARAPARRGAPTPLQRIRRWINWRPNWWFRTLEWRPGDGRYRRQDTLLMRLGKFFVALLIAGAIVAMMPGTPLYLALSFVLSAILATLVFRTRVPLFRLVRPPLENLSIFLCLAVIASGIVLFAELPRITHPAWSFPWPVIGFIGYMIVGFLLFRAPVRVLADRLFWSVVDYGTSAARLAIVIGVLMLVTFVLATDRANFEPTLVARTEHNARQLIQQHLTSRGNVAADASSIWDARENPYKERWPIGERIWMTLRYHVPLVNAVTSEEWQPSTKYMRFMFLPPGNDDDPRPAWWPRWWLLQYWPRARDWFGFMSWVNWVLWPLFLPFLIRILTRPK